MMRLVVLAVAVCAVAGCGFASGFRDEALKQGAQIGAEVIADRLGDKYSDLGRAISEIPGKLPKPAEDDPVKDTMGYSIGALIAYILGSGAKGLIRSKATGRNA